MPFSRSFFIAYKFLVKHYISLYIKNFNLIFYKILITFLSILVITIFFPILISFSFCSLLNFFKSTGTFIGIREIASNIRSIQLALDAHSTPTNSLIIPHIYKYTNNLNLLNTNVSTLKYTKYYDININNICRKHVFVNLINLFIFPVLFIKYFINNNTWIFIWNKTFLPYNLDLFF